MLTPGFSQSFAIIWSRASLTTATTRTFDPWLTVSPRLMTRTAVLFAKSSHSSFFTQSTNNPVF